MKKLSLIAVLLLGVFSFGYAQKKLRIGKEITTPSGLKITLTKKGKRSEEHTSELQSHSFISYAVFCLKKKRPA